MISDDAFLPPQDLPDEETIAKGTLDWPHAPLHRLAEEGVYFVTARTRDGLHLLESPEMKDWFQESLIDLLEEDGWQLEAWAVLSNHYHFVAHSPSAKEGAAVMLGGLIQKLHSLSTKEANRREEKPGRSRLWQNYRETLITFQSSYLARLNYVHQNPVHHGLVSDAREWKWGSAARFEQSVTPAWAKTIQSFSFDKIAKEDGD